MKNRIETIIRKAAGAKAIFDVFEPERKEFGNYSTNVALRLAKIERKDPMKLAHDLVSKIREHERPMIFEKIEVAPPGFINFWLLPSAIVSSLHQITKEKENYGSSRIGKGEKVQVEFISANPTGPLTLANGRGGFLGDALANVLGRTSFAVEREYYVNDSGNQILTFGKSILAIAGLHAPKEEFYKGDYLKEWAAKHKGLIRRHISRPLQLGQIAAKDFLRDIAWTVKRRARIRFDRFTSEEKNIRGKSFVKKALVIFEDKKSTYEKDGAVWLKTTEFGDDKDRVLITRDGFPTYFLVDAGHFLETAARGFRRKILVLGPDHHGYMKRIQAVTAILGFKKLDIIVTQTIRLMREDEKIKMSKRKGEFVSFKELIDEVGADAARFFLLMVSPETHMDFDLSLAKERSTKNPVYYVQYSYVRATSVLRKTKAMPAGKLRLELLNTPEDTALILKLTQFPGMIEAAAGDYNVQRLTRYATDLANAFHQFYEKERILGEEPHLAAARRELVFATAIVLKNLLDVLGISAPRKM